MKKIFCVIMCFCSIVATAQNLHLSIRAGFFNYNGELQSSAFTFKQAKPGFGVGVKHDLTEHLSARMHVHFASLQANDKKGTFSMQQRNLNFSTKLTDAELGIQYNILNLNDKWYTPYIFVGIGMMKYKPYTTYTTSATKVYLQPLSTEGQGITPGNKAYKLSQLSIPLAIGAEYVLNEDMHVGLEFGYRKLFTDYLDDVSTSYIDETTLRDARGPIAVDFAYRGDEVNAGVYPSAKTSRGNSANKDAYYFVALTFTWRFELDAYKRIAGIPTLRKDKKVGCPAVRY